MDSPHIVFARWIDSLLSEHKEAIQKQEDRAAEEIRVRFVGEDENIFHVADLEPQLEPERNKS
jgi:hypothetical protein